MKTTLDAHPEESSLRSSELSWEQQEVIRKALRSILESPHFRKSKRYPALLEFAVLHTLDGHCSSLKERVVGAEVFGRPSDYDPSSDPVVRIAAGEVRRRLTQYFSEHPEAPVRIDLPVGGYTAEFHFRVQAADQAAFPEQHSPSVAKRYPEEHGPGAAVDLHGRTEAVLERKPVIPARWNRRWTLGVLAAMLVLGIAVFGMWRNQQQRGRHEFWWPVLHDSPAAQIVVGRTLMPLAQNASAASATAASNSARRSNLALEDVFVTTHICTVFLQYGRDCNVTSAPAATLETLRGKPVISIGGFNNEWSPRLLASLPYQFRMGLSTDPVLGRRRAVVLHESTADTPLATMGADVPGAVFTRDYAIIARFHSDLTDSMAVVIAGLGPEGTDGAGKFLFSPDDMNQFFAGAPKTWKGSNFEAVLEIDVVHGTPGPIKVMATKFW